MRRRHLMSDFSAASSGASYRSPSSERHASSSSEGYSHDYHGDYTSWDPKSGRFYKVGDIRGEVHRTSMDHIRQLRPTSSAVLLLARQCRCKMDDCTGCTKVSEDSGALCSFCQFTVEKCLTECCCTCQGCDRDHQHGWDTPPDTQCKATIGQQSENVHRTSRGEVHRTSVHSIPHLPSRERSRSPTLVPAARAAAGGGYSAAGTLLPQQKETVQQETEQVDF